MRDKVIIKRRTNLPLVTIAIAARAGVFNEPEADAGLTGLMARTSLKGTANRSAGEIAEEAEDMGGTISPSVTSDVVDWEITVPARHFERALELLGDVALNASFPEAEFEVERKLAIADVQQMRDDMYRHPARLCLQQAFRGHAYGHSIEAVEASLRAATPERTADWHRNEIRAEPWVFVVGDVDPESAAALIEQHIPQGVIATPEHAARATWGGPATAVETRDKAQTALALAFPGPLRNDEHRYVLSVMANAVGGLGGRFFEELRSKRSLAYTVSLLRISRRLGGAFIAYIATAPEREEEARSALLEQFALLRNEPLTEAEVARSIRYTIGTWQIRNQTNTARLGELLQACLIGDGQSEIEQFEGGIRAVTPEAIMEVANKYFDPAVRVEGIVRGKAKA